MSDVLSRELPAPRRWQELESLAFDIYRRLWKTNDAELHGRTGQPQAGVDVYGTDRESGLFTGVQCKGKDADYGGSLTAAELRAEVAKALTFQPPLDAFVLLTTAPNDAAIQKIARELSADNKRDGLFEVQVTGWDTFRHYIAERQDVLVKYFSDYAPVDLQSRMAADADLQAQGLARIESNLRTLRRDISGLREGDTDDPLAERVSEVGRLTSDGSPKAALRALERMFREDFADATPLARYRLFASMGNARFALGEEAEAVKLFKQAQKAHPTYPNAKTTLAIAMLLEGDREGAFKQSSDAFAADPNSARTAGVLIDAAPESITIDDLCAQIGSDLLEDAEVSLHLALRAHRAGEYALNLEFAERALAAAPEDWRALSGVAETIMQPLSDIGGLALIDALPEDQRAVVERATKLNLQAWDVLKNRDSTFQGRHVGANLITLLTLSGRNDEADAVMERGLLDSPDYGPFVTCAAQRSASRGDWKAAAAALDRADLKDLSFDGLLLRTHAAQFLGDTARAIELIEELEARSATEINLPERAQLLKALRVRSAISAGADSSAVISKAISDSPKAIVLRSFLFDQLDEGDPLRIRIADEIRELAGGDLTIHERLHAAETLAAAGNHSLAADLYGGLHKGGNCYALRRQLQELHYADRRAEARRLFESLPSDVRTEPSYLGLGVHIYERAGLLKAALALVEKALTVHDVLSNRLAWIQMLARTGRPEDFLEWLGAVPSDIDGSANDLMTLARLIDQFLGYDQRSLEIGYRALRVGYGRAEMHLSYAIGLILIGQPDQTVLAAPETIAAGSGVVLVNDATEETLFRIIETASDPVIERGEIGLDDLFARRLLGLKVGDTIDVAKAAGAAQEYRVAEIQSRYHFAMGRTLRDFQTLFPDNTAFGSFKIDDAKGENRFEEMFALARQRAERGREIEAIYRDKPLPLPMVAKFAGVSPFDVWDGFSAQADLGVKSAIGINEEFAAGRKAACGGILVVDPVTIYGWCRMGLAPLIENAGFRMAVVQSSIDALRRLLEERENKRGRDTGTFGWDGENYRLVELTEEILASQVAAASEALELAEKLLLVAAESNRPVPQKFADFFDELDPAYIDTLIAASHSNRCLLSDDLGFRVIAQEAGASGTWSQAFAQAAHMAGGMTHPEYRTVVSALIEANHSFTQFRPADIVGEVLEARWSVNDRLRKYIEMMFADTVDRSSVASLIAQVLIESKVHAPDDAKYARFHVAYAEAGTALGKAETARDDYERAMSIIAKIIERKASRLLFPQFLRETTYLTPLSKISAETHGIAMRQTQLMRESLERGGLWRALAKKPQ